MSSDWKLQRRLEHPSDNLILFLIVSILLHAVAFLGGENYWQPSVSPQVRPAEGAIPVEYVEVPATQVAVTPPPETKQRASTNAIAGGNARPELPVSAGAGGAAALPSSQSSSSQSQASTPQPSQPEQSSQQPPSTPLVDLQTSVAGNLNINAPTPKSRKPEANRQKASLAKRSIKAASQNASNRSPQPASNPGPAKRPNANRSESKSQKQGVDAQQDSLLGPYLTSLERQVDVQWRLPEKPNASYRLMVAFSVNRQGQLTALRVVKSSGSSLRDQAALKAVQQAAPFSPLPAGYRKDQVDVEYEFKNIVERKSKSSQP